MICPILYMYRFHEAICCKKKITFSSVQMIEKNTKTKDNTREHRVVLNK